MRKRGFWGVLGLVMGAAALPARSQVGSLPFRLPPPASLRSVGGFYTVRWEDVPEGGIDPGLFSITWYYASRADGSDRKRMTTQFRDDFSGGFRRNWKPEGPFVFDWTIRRDTDRRGRRDLLCGTKDAGPCVSMEGTEGNVVVSALVRPQGLRNEFSLGLRVQRTLKGYELRNDGSLVRLLRSGVALEEKPLPDLRPRRWYWYEIGLRSFKNEVIIRVRIYDEKHERVLVSFNREDRPRDAALLKGGLIALWGPAEFAEVYVDPWEARWVDDPKNSFRWDTSQVPDGSYVIIAELSDGKGGSHLVTSDYRVEVRSIGQARTN